MYQQLSFWVHGNADHQDGIIESISVLLAFFEGATANGPGGILPALLPGLTAMANFHPLVVHFPIALLFTFLAVEVLALILKKPAWREAATVILVAGALGAVIAVIAGFSAANSIEHGGNVHEIMENHEHIGVIVMALAVVLALWRLFIGKPLTGGANTLFLIISVVMCLLLSFGADLGGLMVYQYGVAVKAVTVTDTSHSHGEH
ncbi:DUF2231 domain-containing protein [Methylocucumis oryzae]|uniref:Membrane protein n=1 Tax=Methylocucumis oryzae TaxID=1632867 RepID=A0A0F3IMA4_9GAMM|nr:DUF2231 domain-containing protein [Methylocucumis oryzae]KJV06669.1 membrane protein [Methylocucumis oryzae]